MKKSFTLVLALVLIAPLVMRSQHKDNFKIDALGFFRKTTKISWEHFTAPTNSITLSTQLSDNMLWDDADQKLVRLGLSAEYRYYVGKKINYSGLYIGVQLRYQHLKYQGNRSVYNYNLLESTNFPLNQTINTAGYGLVFGFQELTGKDKKTAIDMNFGFVWNTGSSSIRKTKLQNDGIAYEFTGLVGVFPQASFAYSFGL